MSSRAGQEVLAVAALTFRESARNRVLHALVIAMFLAAGSSYVLAWVSGTDQNVIHRHKIVADLSLSAITLLGTLAAIFLGTNLIYQEVQRRTIHSVLARPISRGGFIVGKYLGLAGVMGVAVLAMGTGFFVIFGVGGGSPTGALILAVFLIYVELAVITAVAIFFSAVAHPIEGAVFTFVVALAGHQTASLNDLGTEMITGTKEFEPTLAHHVMHKVLYGIYVLFPNLENFNVRGEAVYGLPIEASAVLLSLLYAVVYITILLVVASLLFRRRLL